MFHLQLVQNPGKEQKILNLMFLENREGSGHILFSVADNNIRLPLPKSVSIAAGANGGPRSRVCTR